MDKNIWCGHKGAKVATVGLYISTSSQQELLSWLLNHRTIFVQTAFRKIFCLQEGCSRDLNLPLGVQAHCWQWLSKWHLCEQRMCKSGGRRISPSRATIEASGVFLSVSDGGKNPLSGEYNPSLLDVFLSSPSSLMQQLPMDRV